MLVIASKIVVCLVLVSIISFLLGYLIAKAKYKSADIVKYDTSSKPMSRKTGNIYNKPLIYSQPRPTGKDDLKLIEGIDGKMEKDLNILGVYHFEQIAKWSDKNVEWISEYFSLEEDRIKHEKWVSQAKEVIKR